MGGNILGMHYLLIYIVTSLYQASESSSDFWFFWWEKLTIFIKLTMNLQNIDFRFFGSSPFWCLSVHAADVSGYNEKVVNWVGNIPNNFHVAICPKPPRIHLVNYKQQGYSAKLVKQLCCNVNETYPLNLPIPFKPSQICALHLQSRLIRTHIRPPLSKDGVRSLQK